MKQYKVTIKEGDTVLLKDASAWLEEVQDHPPVGLWDRFGNLTLPTYDAIQPGMYRATFSDGRSGDMLINRVNGLDASFHMSGELTRESS